MHTSATVSLPVSSRCIKYNFQNGIKSSPDHTPHNLQMLYRVVKIDQQLFVNVNLYLVRLENKYKLFVLK